MAKYRVIWATHDYGIEVLEAESAADAADIIYEQESGYCSDFKIESVEEVDE